MYKMLESFYRGKRILVTGHTGFKGSWLCKLLCMLNADVYGYSLEPPTEPSIYELIGLNKRISSTIGDVRDYGKLLSYIEKIKPELIFHMAAQPIVRESYRIPRDTFETNIMGTVNVLEAARVSCCVKGILNVTTDKVYENPEQSGHRFTEEEKLDGFDP